MAAARRRTEPSTTPRYPLTSHLELGARPTAVPCARMITKQVIREWELPDLVETAELLVEALSKEWGSTAEATARWSGS